MLRSRRARTAATAADQFARPAAAATARRRQPALNRAEEDVAMVPRPAPILILAAALASLALAACNVTANNDAANNAAANNAAPPAASNDANTNRPIRLPPHAVNPRVGGGDNQH
jgi:hypothetical protein